MHYAADREFGQIHSQMPSVYRHKAAAFPSAPEARKYRSTRVNAPEPTAPSMANSKLMAGTENENLQKKSKAISQSVRTSVQTQPSRPGCIHKTRSGKKWSGNDIQKTQQIFNKTPKSIVTRPTAHAHVPPPRGDLHAISKPLGCPRYTPRIAKHSQAPQQYSSASVHVRYAVSRCLPSGD